MLKSEAQLPPFIVEWQRSDKDGVVMPVIVPTQTTCVCGVLKIRVISARDLFRVPRSKKDQSPYAELRVGDLIKKGPKDDEGGTSAQWDSEDMEFHLDGRQDDLHLEIFNDHRRTNGRETIGKTMVPLKSLLQLANPTAYLGVDDSLANDPFFFHEAWFNISRDHGKMPAGRVLLRTSFVADFQRARNMSSHIPERLVSSGSKLFGGTIAQAVTVSDFSVPVLMHRCCEYLLSNATDVVGVFRITADQNDLDSAKTQLEANPLLDFSDVHVCAAVLKAYLRELAEPVIPFSHYEFFIEWAKKRPNPKDEPTQEELEAYQALVASMASIHRESLKFLCNFLAEMASHSEQTKMDVRNLSIVLAPNILRVAHKARLEKKSSWFPGSYNKAHQMEEDANALMNAKHILTCMEVLTNHHKYLFATGINDRTPSRDHSTHGRSPSKDKSNDSKSSSPLPSLNRMNSAPSSHRSSSTSRSPATRTKQLVQVSPLPTTRSRSPPAQHSKTTSAVGSITNNYNASGSVSSSLSLSESSRRETIERGSLMTDKDFVLLSVSAENNGKNDIFLSRESQVSPFDTPPSAFSLSSSPLPPSYPSSLPTSNPLVSPSSQDILSSSHNISNSSSNSNSQSGGPVCSPARGHLESAISPRASVCNPPVPLTPDLMVDTVDRLTQENLDLYDRLAALAPFAEGEVVEELQQMHQRSLKELARLESDLRLKETELKHLRHKAPPPPSPKYPSYSSATLPAAPPSHLTSSEPTSPAVPSRTIEMSINTLINEPIAENSSTASSPLSTPTSPTPASVPSIQPTPTVAAITTATDTTINTKSTTINNSSSPSCSTPLGRGRRTSSPSLPNSPVTPKQESRRKSGTKGAAAAVFSSFPSTSAQQKRKKSSVTAKENLTVVVSPYNNNNNSNSVTISVAETDLPASVIAAQSRNSPRQPSPAPPRSRSPAPQRNPPPPPAAPLLKPLSRSNSRQ